MILWAEPRPQMDSPQLCFELLIVLQLANYRPVAYFNGYKTLILNTKITSQFTKKGTHRPENGELAND